MVTLSERKRSHLDLGEEAVIWTLEKKRNVYLCFFEATKRGDGVHKIIITQLKTNNNNK
jgi:hypothetical protein